MPRSPARKSSRAQPIHYRIELAELKAHLFQVTLTIPQPAAQQRVSLPVWIPGSYLVREFSKNLQKLEARQSSRAIPAEQTDKCSWRISCDPGRPLVLSYQIYALDNSVRTAWLDSARGFFNGTILCLRVEGLEDVPHELELVPGKSAANWSAATGLPAKKINRRGFGPAVARHLHDRLC